MGNHRAEPGAQHGPRSEETPARPYVGKRVASRPVDATPQTDETPVVRMSPSPTVEIPVLGSSRPVTPGKRRAAARSSRKSLFGRLPTMPTLVGAATLAVAIGGAVTTAHPDLTSSPQSVLSAPNAMSGSFGSGSVAADRPQTISRDSDRDALQGATGTQLVSEAERVSAERNSALGVLAKDAEKKAHEIAANRWVLPIDAGVYHLTARFGECSGLWGNCHTGLDFAAPTGTPIHAIADGVIESTAYDGSYGNKTVETLADGTEIWYAHQNAFNTSPGARVVQGQIIGYVGSTGNTTGPHVHIEVRPGAGDPVDPDPAFVQHGISPDANQ